MIKNSQKNHISNGNSGVSIVPVLPGHTRLMAEFRIAYLKELDSLKKNYNLIGRDNSQNDTLYKTTEGKHSSYSAIDNHENLREELSNFFKRAMAEKRFFAFMATEKRNVLGFGAIITKEIPGDFLQSSYLEGDILNMYVIPMARRRGISSLILQKLIDEAKKKGISKISLHTTTAGEKLYKKFGFSNPEFPVLELIKYE